MGETMGEDCCQQMRGEHAMMCPTRAALGPAAPPTEGPCPSCRGALASLSHAGGCPRERYAAADAGKRLAEQYGERPASLPAHVSAKVQMVEGLLQAGAFGSAHAARVQEQVNRATQRWPDLQQARAAFEPHQQTITVSLEAWHIAQKQLDAMRSEIYALRRSVEEWKRRAHVTPELATLAEKLHAAQLETDRQENFAETFREKLNQLRPAMVSAHQVLLLMEWRRKGLEQECPACHVLRSTFGGHHKPSCALAAALEALRGD